MDEHRHDRLTVTAMIIAIILLVAVNLTFILMKPAGTGMERSVTEPLMRINEQGDWTGISQAQADGLVWAKREEILDHAAYDDSLSPASSIVSMSWRGTGRSRNGSRKRGVTTA